MTDAGKQSRLRSTPPRDLPDHVAAGDEWKAWPRKTEAHVQYGARERQITAYCREGRLVVWRCPDDSLRLDPSALEELYGKPGTFAGRDRAPQDDLEREARRSRKEATFEADDPFKGLVKELALLLKEQRQEKTDILRMVLEHSRQVVDPLNVIIGLFQALTTHAMGRVRELEARELETALVRDELLSSRHARDLETKAAEATQKRRDEVMGLLRQRLPALLDGVTGIGSLAAFVKTLDPALIETLLEMNVLKAEQADQLRKAAGIVDKTQNGKGSHGVDPGATNTTQAGAQA